jgi:glutathione S-transferase
MLTLYHSPGSCALASHIALEESGLAYTAVRVDLAGGQQTRPEYLALNPKGRVPALATARGVITENVAILAFIAQSAPAAGLAPLDDPFAFAAMQAFNSYLASTVHVAHAHGRRGYRWVDDSAALAEMQRKVPETMAACFALIEAEMFAGPWVMGEAYTIADPYLFTIARWLEDDRVDPAQFPKVLDHRNRMGARQAVRRVLAALEA